MSDLIETIEHKLNEFDKHKKMLNKNNRKTVKQKIDADYGNDTNKQASKRKSQFSKLK